MLGLVEYKKRIDVFNEYNTLKVRNGGFLDENFSYDFSRGRGSRLDILSLGRPNQVYLSLENLELLILF